MLVFEIHKYRNEPLLMRLQTSDGIVPLISLLFVKWSHHKLDSKPTSVGMVPVNELRYK